MKFQCEMWNFLFVGQNWNRFRLEVRRMEGKQCEVLSGECWGKQKKIEKARQGSQALKLSPIQTVVWRVYTKHILQTSQIFATSSTRTWSTIVEDCSQDKIDEKACQYQARNHLLLWKIFIEVKFWLILA